MSADGKREQIGLCLLGNKSFSAHRSGIPATYSRRSLSGLPGNDGDIADLQPWRRNHDKRGIDLRQFSSRRWREVGAVFLPGPVNLFHARLDGFAFSGRKVRIE